MQPDVEKYLPYLEEFDIPRAKKVELIHTVAAIMESFVDRAFGLHPVQLSQGDQGRPDSADERDRIDSVESIFSSEFQSATAKEPEGRK